MLLLLLVCLLSGTRRCRGSTLASLRCGADGETVSWSMDCAEVSVLPSGFACTAERTVNCVAELCCLCMRRSFSFGSREGTLIFFWNSARGRIGCFLGSLRKEKVFPIQSKPSGCPPSARGSFSALVRSKRSRNVNRRNS